jgi:PDZ domain-containing protein
VAAAWQAERPTPRWSTVTTDQLAPEHHAEEPPPPRRWSPRARWFAVVGALVVIGAITAALVVQLPYYTLSPGSARATEPLITVEGAPTYDTDGNVDFLTVSLRRATPVELLAAWINPAVDVKSREELFGDQTDSENREANLQMMAGSKDSATYQALNRLGYDIPTSGTGAQVATVAEGSPACGELAPGDVVTALDGQPVTMSSELVDDIGASAPGTTVTMQVSTVDLEGIDTYDAQDNACPAPEREPGGSRSVELALGARDDDPSKAFLGVSTFTKDLTFDFPVDVTIDSGRVGGPSAGLAFTLGLLDVMSPGSITGGLRVATTGTMGLDGRVGPIGGVHQKVVAAQREGVELMLVPTSELEEARKYADGLRIEGVDDLDQALAVLATVGGGDAVLPPEPESSAVG